MRKLTFLLIIMCYLSAVTELHEFLKAANLIAHFMHHHQQDKTLSFADFIQMHYDYSSAHACGEEHNDQLPFKSHHASVVLLNFIEEIPCISCEGISVWSIEDATWESFYSAIATSSAESAIWQPPKAA